MHETEGRKILWPPCFREQFRLDLLRKLIHDRWIIKPISRQPQSLEKVEPQNKVQKAFPEKCLLRELRRCRISARQPHQIFAQLVGRHASVSGEKYLALQPLPKCVEFR